MKKTPVTFKPNASFPGKEPGFTFSTMSIGDGHKEYQLFKVEHPGAQGQLQWMPVELDTEEAVIAYAKWKLSQ